MVTSAGNGISALPLRRGKLPAQPPESEYAAARMRLTLALQTSLDLETVLQTFMAQASELVPLGGLHYQLADQDCDLRLGGDYRHNLNYSLQTPQQNLGEIRFCRRQRFAEAEMAALEHLLASLLFPLRNALLYRAAVRTSLQDPLTGCGNRQALSNALARETDLAQRYRHPLSLLVLDIDHFKRINDEHGHSCGDEVLRQLGLNIRAIARCTDLSFRYGGEEFVVLLSETGAAGAATIAERMRHRIARLKIETHNQLLRISASIGVASRHDWETGEELFQRADQALYEAKRGGRNRVVSAD